MAVTVGGVVIKLLCDSASFQKDWDKADRKIMRIAQGWDRTGKALTRSLTRPLVVGGLAALAYQVNWSNLAKKAGQSIAKHSQDLTGLQRSMNDLKRSGATLGDSFAQSLAPALDAVAQALVPIADNVGKLAVKFAEQGQGTQKMIVGAALLAAGLGPVYRLLALIAKLWVKIGSVKFGAMFAGAAPPQVKVALLAMVTLVGALNAAWAIFHKKADTTRETFKDISGHIKDMVAGSKQLQLMTPKAPGEVGGTLSPEMEAYFKKWDKRTTAADTERARFLGAYVAEEKEIKARIDAIVAQWLFLDELINITVPKLKPKGPRGGLMPEMPKEWTGPTTYFEKPVPTFITGIKAIAAQIEGLAETTQGWGDMWADTVSQAIVDGRMLQLKFSDFFRQIGADIMYMLAKLQLIDPLVKSLNNWLLPLGSAVGAGASAGTGGGGVGGSGLYPGFQSYQPQGQGLSVNVHNHAGAQVDVTSGRSASGAPTVDIVLSAFNAGVGSGKVDRTMSGAYGIRRKSVNR